jgi:methylmalonyl-CoA epimerase
VKADYQKGRRGSMIEKIDHIGIAVKDIVEQSKYYRDTLGMKVSPIEAPAGAKNKVVFVDTGNTEIELLQDATGDGTIAKFIQNRGEGIHHIAYLVDDIVKELEKLKAKGLTLIDTQPRPGARGSLVAFIHPKTTYGVLVELCQEAKK